MEEGSLDTGDLLSEMSTIELGLLQRVSLVSRLLFGTEVCLVVYHHQCYAYNQILEIGQSEPTQTTLMNPSSPP